MLSELATQGDAESRFALGARFPFQEAGMYELELIHGIADMTALRILEVKEDLLLKNPSALKRLGNKRIATLENYFSFP